MVHAATLLGQAALKAGTPEAAAAAAHAVQPLLLLSLCHGRREELAARAAPAEAAAPPAPPPPLLELPPDIPPELLEGTVEGQQLLAQQAQQGGHFVAATGPGAATAAAPQAAQPGSGWGGDAGGPTTLVHIQDCWRLGARESLALLEQVLLPLAARHASHDLVHAITADAAPGFELPPPEGGAGEGAEPAVASWQPPQLADLAHQAVAAAPGSGASRERSEGEAGNADPADPAVAARMAVLAAVVQAALQPAATVLTDSPLPFGDAGLPWDTPGVLFVSDGPGGGASRPGRRPPGEGAGALRSLSRRISSLVHASSGEGGGAGRERSAAEQPPPDPLAGVEDVEGMHSLLGSAVEVSAGGALPRLHQRVERSCIPAACLLGNI